MTQQLLAAAAVLFGFAVSRRASGEDAAPDLEAVATPSAARGFDEPLPLSPEQVASWRERGFAVVDGLLPAALVAAARDDLRDMEVGPLTRGAQFPSGSAALDAVSTHARLRAAVAQLLGAPRLQLLQSEAWSKRAEPSAAAAARALLGAGAAYSNADQRMHMDYPNHYLTHPAPWDTPEAVAAIVHFDDAREVGGRTRVVPREGADDPAYAWPYARMPGVGGVAWVNDRATAEAAYAASDPATARFRAALYARELEVDSRPGTVLLYRFDTWHRGAPLAPRAPPRRVLNLAYARDDVTVITPWNCRVRARGDGDVRDVGPEAAEFGFARAMYFGAEGELDRASVARKTRLGVPPPGSAYWTPELREAVAARFPNGDWRAYTSDEPC